MEKPYQIEDEKDLADTRYRWQYRAGIVQKQRRVLIIWLSAVFIIVCI